jgi:hypothetical protein
MRTILLTHLRTAGLIGAFGLLLAAPGRAQTLPLLSLTPAAQNISLGQTTTVNLTITGLGATKLGGWSTDVSYLSNVVTFNAALATFGSQLSVGAPSIQFVSDGPGSLWFHGDETADAAANLNGQPGTFTLATFSFTGFGVGTSNLLFDIDFTSLSDEAGASIPFQVSNALINVGGGATSVPDSASALPLLGLSIAVMLLARRFRRSAG